MATLSPATTCRVVCWAARGAPKLKSTRTDALRMDGSPHEGGTNGVDRDITGDTVLGRRPFHRSPVVDNRTRRKVARGRSVRVRSGNALGLLEIPSARSPRCKTG